MTLPAPKRYRTRREERIDGAQRAHAALTTARDCERRAAQLLDEAGAPPPPRLHVNGPTTKLDQQARLAARLSEARKAPGTRERARALATARQLLREAERLCWDAVLASDVTVRNLARSYGRARDAFDDEYQVARLGAQAAAKRWSPARKVTFATYSRWWIVAALTRQIPTYNMPGNAAEKLRNVLKAGREGLDDAGIAARLSLTVEDVREIRDWEAFSRPTSLERPDRDGNTLGDFLAAPADDERMHDADAERAFAALMRLEPRHRRLLQLRFGVGCAEHTLSQAGTAIGVSRERARQIEREALYWIRADLGLVTFDEVADRARRRRCGRRTR